MSERAVARRWLSRRLRHLAEVLDPTPTGWDLTGAPDVWADRVRAASHGGSAVPIVARRSRGLRLRWVPRSGGPPAPPTRRTARAVSDRESGAPARHAGHAGPPAGAAPPDRGGSRSRSRPIIATTTTATTITAPTTTVPSTAVPGAASASAHDRPDTAEAPGATPVRRPLVRAVAPRPRRRASAQAPTGAVAVRRERPVPEGTQSSTPTGASTRSRSPVRTPVPIGPTLAAAPRVRATPGPAPALGSPGPDVAVRGVAGRSESGPAPAAPGPWGPPLPGPGRLAARGEPTPPAAAVLPAGLWPELPARSQPPSVAVPPLETTLAALAKVAAEQEAT